MDKERISDKLDELERYLGELRDDLPEKQEHYIQNRRRRRACEKDFELLSECVVDICNLVISGKELGKPADNKDSVNKLVENSILPKSLGERIKNMLGLRNLLVHKYGKIDNSQVYDHFREELSDVHDFIEKMDEFLNE